MESLLVRRVLAACLLSFLASGISYAYEPGLPSDDYTPPSNGQNGDLNTNTQNSNNNNSSTTNIGNNAGSRTPVPTSVAPSMISTGDDSCLMSRSSGLQLLDIGLSGGYYQQDEECNRRRDAKVFRDLGMMIPAISRMCQNEDNWKAMFVSGTPCPILVGGRMVYGKRATLAMRSQPALYIPDYEDNKEYYDSVLGIGKGNEADKENTGESISVSERFRSSARSESVD